jgi:hypothetical protein
MYHLPYDDFMIFIAFSVVVVLGPAFVKKAMFMIHRKKYKTGIYDSQSIF